MSFVLYPHIRDYTGLGAARVIAVAYSLTFAGLSLTHAQGRAFPVRPCYGAIRVIPRTNSGLQEWTCVLTACGGVRARANDQCHIANQCQ